MHLFNKVSDAWLKYKHPLLISGLIIYSLALGVEFYALKLALNDQLLTAFIMHFIASLVMAWPLCSFMPMHFRTSFSILIFLFLLCFFIPVVSSILLPFSLCLALYFTKKPESDVFDYNEPLHAEKVITNALSKPDYCNGRIFGVLRFAKENEKRIKAVLATNQLADEVAIPILRIALLDSVDEVRLMAYSILDTKEKEIDSIIHQGLNQINSKKLNHKGARKVHHRLAEAYWELSYLGLVKGRAREHTLHSAMKHANKALKLRSKETSLYLLQVQVLTCLGYFKEADMLLQMTGELGIAPEKLAARSAELAFELKRFTQVSEHVKKLEGLAKNNIILDGMVKQWAA